jgi:DNA-binding MarR family transcriptional regulator
MVASTRSFPLRVSSIRRKLGPEATLEFLQALWALDQELRALSKHMERRMGVTGPQRLALRIVGLAPGLPASGLASALHLHPSTVTGLITRLTRKGLIRRRRDPEDGRRVLLVLTPRGARINSKNRGTVEAAVSRSLGDLAPGHLATVRNVIEQIRQSVLRERAERSSR